MLAEKNIYNNSAYRRLQAISQDDGKRMEYEARQKAIRNYNEGLLEAEERGEKRGILGTISSLWDFGHSIGGHLLRRVQCTGGKNTGCPNREDRYLHPGK